jgi:hypothetical protein
MNCSRLKPLLAPLLLVFATLPTLAQPAKYGKFPEHAQTEWLDDGRRMVLLRDFVFIEPNGTTWLAKAAHKPPKDGDLVIDGATIPPVFWSIIGGPYEGLYRNGSIVHDAECVEPHKHRWQDVHRMLYRAALAGGTSQLAAKLIFAAVWHFGPRWPWQGESFAPSALQRVGDALRLAAYIIKSPEISLPAIEAISSESLAANVSDDEYERFRRQLEDCNDPNGHFLGSRANMPPQRYRRDVMSSPTLPCHGQ